MSSTAAALPPVVLVHGFASSFRRNWVDPGWVALLEDAGRTVVGVDLLGHGDAPRPHDPSAYDALDERVRDALVGSVDAVGFSLGARVLLRLATVEPTRFRRLVLGGIGANVFADGRAEALAAAITGEGAADDPVRQAFVRFAHQPGNDPLALAACLRRSDPPLEPEALAGVTCPTLVVIGDRDFVGPADGLVAALPSATLVTLKGVDHLATPNDFGFIDATLEFLAG